jgi:glucose-6-phosphate dehydrogenase assembly protein OpcA
MHGGRIYHTLRIWVTGMQTNCNKTVIAGLYASRLKVFDLGRQAGRRHGRARGAA